MSYAVCAWACQLRGVERIVAYETDEATNSSNSMLHKIRDKESKLFTGNIIKRQNFHLFIDYLKQMFGHHYVTSITNTHTRTQKRRLF